MKKYEENMKKYVALGPRRRSASRHNIHFSPYINTLGLEKVPSSPPYGLGPYINALELGKIPTFPPKQAPGLRTFRALLLPQTQVAGEVKT